MKKEDERKRKEILDYNEIFLTGLKFASQILRPGIHSPTVLLQDLSETSLQW